MMWERIRSGSDYLQHLPGQSRLLLSQSRAQMNPRTNLLTTSCDDRKKWPPTSRWTVPTVDVRSAKPAGPRSHSPNRARSQFRRTTSRSTPQRSGVEMVDGGAWTRTGSRIERRAAAVRAWVVRCCSMTMRKGDEARRRPVRGSHHRDLHQRGEAPPPVDRRQAPTDHEPRSIEGRVRW